jgi:hypothetical protein
MKMVRNCVVVIVPIEATTQQGMFITEKDRLKHNKGCL